MHQKSLIYSNAKIKALENTILNFDKYSRLSSAKNLAEAVKVLQEVGYGQGANISDGSNYETLLFLEEKKIVDFLKEVMPKKGGLENFILEIDIQNIKYFMKSKYLKKKDKEMPKLPEGKLSLVEIKENIMLGQYKSFDDDIRKALEQIDLYFQDNKKNGQYIDVVLDKLMYKKIIDNLTKGGDKLLKNYYTDKIDFINFSTFLRSRVADLKVREFENLFISGGSIELDDFVSKYDLTNELLIDYFKYKKNGKVFENAIIELSKKKKLASFEKEVDDILLGKLKENRNDIFSISPIASFYKMKMLEIRMVRLILVCIKTGLERNYIKERMRREVI